MLKRPLRRLCVLRARRRGPAVAHSCATRGPQVARAKEQMQSQMDRLNREREIDGTLVRARRKCHALCAPPTFPLPPLTLGQRPHSGLAAQGTRLERAVEALEAMSQKQEHQAARHAMQRQMMVKLEGVVETRQEAVKEKEKAVEVRGCSPSPHVDAPRAPARRAAPVHRSPSH